MPMLNQISIRRNSIDYINFNSVSFRKSLVEFCGGYDVAYTDIDNKGIQFKADDDIELLIDDNKVFTGYVSSFSGEIDSGMHILRIKGKDKTIDFAQSSITENIEFTNTVKLEDVIQAVLTSLDIDDIQVINKLDIKPFETGEIVSAEVGDNALQFVEKYARKRQVLLTTTKDGNIELQQANFTDNGDVLQLIHGNPTNNVLFSSFERDFDNVYAQYTCKCSDALSTGDLNEDFVDRIAVATFDDARPARKTEIILDAASIDTLQKRAIWEKNCRLNGGVYRCRVQGFYNSLGEVYFPNMGLVQVTDDTWGINKKMLIKAVSFSFSNSGAVTDLTLVDPIAFSTIDDYEYNFEEGSIIKI